MDNLNVIELDKSQLRKYQGGLILANVKFIDKALRAAGVYEFLEGVIDGLKGCGCDK